MERKKLEQFISKYNLGGLSSQAIINYTGEQLLTKFKTDQNDLFGMVAVKDIKIDGADETSFGVFNTDLIRKVLSAMQSEINLSFDIEHDMPTSLNISDNVMSSRLLLADLDVIDSPPSINELPEFEAMLPINTIFIDRFIKARNALPDSTTVSFIVENDSVDIVFNYSENHNTDKISMNMELSNSVSNKFTMTFNVDVIKEVLTANKDCQSGVLKLSSAGLSEYTFTGENFKTKYYIVMLQG